MNKQTKLRGNMWTNSKWFMRVILSFIAR